MVSQLKYYLFIILLSVVVNLFLIPLLPVQSVRADGIIVNSLLDTVANDGACTLREAIINANNDNQSGSSDCLAGSGFDVIMFNSSGTISLNSVLPDILEDLQIDGAGQSIMIDGNNTHQIMRTSGSSNQVIINGLTLQNGASEVGGALWNNSSKVTINDSTFRANTAITTGGAIHNIQTMTINRSTFENNRVTSTLGLGGAVSSLGTLTLNNSTFYANEATYQGGGLYLSGGNVTTVTNSTFSGNGASNSGGGLYVAINTLHLRNTILANSSLSNDCGKSGSGTIDTNSGNLITNDGCGLADFVTAGPNLSPLADNGGKTKTMAIAASSPAKNAGNNGTCLADDQRGYQRQDGSCDIGAYEVGATTTSPPYNIEIVAGNDLYNISTNGLSYTANGPDARIGVNLLRGSLHSGPVTIETGVPGTGPQQGNITLSAPLDFNGIGLGRSLTLNAADNIRINADISDSAPGGDSLNLTLTGDVDGNGEGFVALLNHNISTHGGNIVMTGQGSNGGTNDGVNIDNATVNAGGGNISITGRGGVGPNAHGIFLENSSTLTTTGSGNITLVGTSGSGLNSRGMLFNNSAHRIQTYDGELRLNGQGQGTNQSTGVGIGAGPVIQALNDGNIFIEGRGSTGPSAVDWTVGVDVYGTVSTVNGDVVINGTGGGTGSNNHGIHMNADGNVTSVGGRISLSGTTTITATGVSYGVFMRGQSSIRGSHGISLNGYDDAEAGIRMESLATIHSQSGPLTMTASSMSMNATTTKISGTNTIRLQPRNSADDFSLTNNELSALANGFSRITIGRDDSRGVIGLSGPTWAVKDPLLIQAPVAGGRISLTTTSDLNGTDNASIELRTAGMVTLGGMTTNRQPITIAHGGMGITPFIVGNASTNGSVNNLTTNDVTVATTQSFLYDHFESPNIWILSGKSICPLGTVAYVNKAVSGGDGNGKDWANAYPELRTVLDTTYPTLCPNVNEVWVARGVYTPGSSLTDSFNMLPSVAVYGGFDGTEVVRSARDFNTNLTVLSGDIDGDDTNTNGVVLTTSHIVGNNVYNIIYNDEVSSSAVLDGFTITAGKANGSIISLEEPRGGGMFNRSSSPTLSNLVFSGNFANRSGGAMFNSAASGKNCSPQLTNVQFSGNFANVNGGAMYNDGRSANSSPKLINVTFYGNTATDRGGAIYNNGIGSTLVNGRSSPELTNVIFYGNVANNEGGAMYNDGTGVLPAVGSSSPKLTNVTFYGNAATNQGGAIYNTGFQGTSIPILTNVILWQNSSSGGRQIYNEYANVTIQHSLIQNGTASIHGPSTYGPGMVTDDPLFIDATSGNLQLDHHSPAIDAGDSTAITLTTDLAEQPRLYDDTGVVNSGIGLVDMGAYERQINSPPIDLAISKTVRPTAVSAGGSLTYTLVLSNVGGYTATNILITDTLPTSLTVTSVNSSGPIITQTSSAPYVWQVANMGAGDRGIITMTGQVTGITNPLTPITLTNQVEITGAGDVITTSNNSSTAILTVVPPMRVVATNPSTHANNAPRTTNVDMTVNDNVNPTTVTSQTVVVHGNYSGRYTQTLSVAGNTVTLNPLGVFKPGEKLDISLTEGVESSSGNVSKPYVWQFTAAVDGGNGWFVDSLQSLGSGESWMVELGDLDGDGDLDAFVANDNGPNEVWRNDGSGKFTQIQTPGTSRSRGVALGDLDGDGDLDAFVGNLGQGNTVWRNDGTGSFVNTSQSLGTARSHQVALGDLDGDGDLDAFVANDGGNADAVWLNDGTGNFGAAATDLLGASNTVAVALGDVDGDGDLDALTGITIASDVVWLNDGSGQFSLGATLAGGNFTRAVALADFDNDGDLDAAIGMFGNNNRIWLNNGAGSFTLSSSFEPSNTIGLDVGDLDGDGDLDLLFGHNIQANSFWLNNGSAGFTPAGQTLPNGNASRGIALGDVDGDGDLDAFIGNVPPAGSANQLWLNEPPPDVAIAKTVTPTIVAAGGAVTYTLHFTNSDSYTVSNIIITDTPPVSLTVMSISNSGPIITQINSAPYVWQVANMGAGDRGIITMTGLVTGITNPLTPITLTNQVEITGAGDVITTSNNSSTAILTVVPPMRVVTTTPSTHTKNAPRTTNVDITVNDNVNPTTVTSQTVVVHGNYSGRYSRTLSVAGNTVTLNPPKPFKPGEKLDISLTEGVESSSGNVSKPYVWQFTAAVDGGNGWFVDSLQSLGNGKSWAVELGDLDGDGDLDAFVANNNGPNEVWRNDGSGKFSLIQMLGSSDSLGVALGDLDGDGDLDAFVGNLGQGNTVWRNDGTGSFVNTSQSLGTANSHQVALGDLDGDGDLDAFVANNNGGNAVWLNDGTGNFGATATDLLGTNNTMAVALGDVDGDGDLDALTGNTNAPDEVWLNDGAGQFSSGATLAGGNSTRAVALADFDGDGDLDAAIGMFGANSRIWLNNGAGGFTQSFSFEPSNTVSLDVGDMDGDGHLDLLFGHNIQANSFWVNDGSAGFTKTQTLPNNNQSLGIALGDVDGDGDLDAFMGNVTIGFSAAANQLWLNEPPPDVAISKSVNPTTALPGDSITYTIRLENQGTSAALNVVVTDTFPVNIINSQVSSGGVVITQTSDRPAYGWQVASITDTQQGFITITGQVPFTIGNVTVITNRVMITATDDLTPTNNIATATLTITRGDCYATHDNGTTVFNSADAQAVGEAGNLASAGGTVKVAGICRGVKQRGSISQTLYISKPLTVRGGYTASNWLTANPTTNPTILDAEGAGRVVFVQSTATTVTLENLILRHGDTTDSGAAIRIIDSVVVISNSQIISNRATIAGGGIYINGSASRLLVQGSQFQNNQASFGGAIKSSSSGQIIGSRFESNQAVTNGGAFDLDNWNTLWQVYTSTFVGNVTQNGHGGAIGTAMPLHIDDSVFRENRDQSGNGGGAIKAFHPLTVTHSRFISNSSTGEGGAIYSSSSLLINDTHFRQNRSNLSGGAIYQSGGAASLSAVEITQNQASDAGGGVAVISGSMSITSSRILTNTALLKGGALYQNSGGTTTIKNSCIVANSDTSLLADSSLAAPNNWWGASSGPSGAGPGSGDSVNNTVDFNGFLAAPTLPKCPILLLADLVISKTVSPLIAKPGDAVQFTLNINNVGLTAATNITLTDLLPTGLTGTGSSNLNLLTDLPGNDYRWRINQLNVGQAVTVIVSATVNNNLLEGGLITNTASISHEAGDLIPNNNIASATLTISATLPDLVISKTVSPTVAQPGQPITYTLTFTNQGDYPADGVVISDVWPMAHLTGTAVLSSSGPPLTQASGPPTYTWQVGTLGVGQSGQMHLSGWLTADLASGITFTNQAHIHGTLTETTQTNNQATAIVMVVAQGVDLYLSKTVSLTEVRPLERVTYTLTIGNQGDTTANNVVISDTLPTALQVLTVSMPANVSQTVHTERKLAWGIAALSAGQQTTIQVVGQVVLTATAGPITNTAFITMPTGSPDVEPNNNQAAVAVTIRQPQADVGVQKTVSPTVAVVGERITYTISFSNASSETALQVILTDSLTDLLTDINIAQASDSPTHPFTISLTTSDRLYRWQVEQLPPQASGLITLSGRLTGVTSMQRFTNNVTITTLSSDTNQTNNQAAVGLEGYARPQLAFSQATYQLAENELTATITATLKTAHVRPVQAVYNSLNNSAVAGLDYLTATGRLTFAPGVTQTTFMVTIVDDKLPESTEQLTLTLTEQGSTGQPSTAQLVIVDDDKPLTTMTLTNNSPIATDQTTTFTLVVSNSNNVPLSYTIDFGDGNGPTTVSSLLTSTLNHIYTQPGTYTVVTTVTNGVNILTSTTTVVIQSPVSNVTLTSPTTPTVSVPLTFTAKVTGGSNLTYTLDFGDGTTTNGSWPSNSPISHTYTQPGTYTVIITAGNQVSLVTDTLVVVVPQPTQPITGLMIIPPPSPLATNKPLPFTAAITETRPISYSWDFGDGTGGSGITPTHVYTQPGSYTVTLTGTDGSITLTTQTTIIVDEPIEGLIVTVGPLTPTVNTPISLTTNVTSGTSISYTIDFGDGTTPLINPPTMPFTHVYTTPGVYTVTITATNSLTTVVTTVVVTVTKPIIPPATDLLRLTHRVSRNEAVMGDYVVYETVLENVGRITATNIQLSHTWPTDGDGLPAFYGFNGQQSQRLAVVQLSKGEVETCLLIRAKLTCQIAYLAPNSRATLNLMLSPRLTGTLVSTAQATAAETDPNPTNNQSRVETTVSVAPPTTTTTTVSAAEIVPQAIYLPLLMK